LSDILSPITLLLGHGGVCYPSNNHSNAFNVSYTKQ
jgi:hypothetical protein